MDFRRKAGARSERRDFGQAIERRTARYLSRQGLRHIQSNFSCRFGEIDLVMIDSSEFLVFVEVRYRSAGHFGSPLDTITASKQRKLKRTAAFYLLSHKRMQDKHCRFDVVAVTPAANSPDYDFDWIKNAFM